MSWLDSLESTPERPVTTTVVSTAAPSGPIVHCALPAPAGFDMVLLSVGFYGDGGSKGVGLYVGPAGKSVALFAVPPSSLDMPVAAQPPDATLAKDMGAFTFPEPVLVPDGQAAKIVFEGSTASRSIAAAQFVYLLLPNN